MEGQANFTMVSFGIYFLFIFYLTVLSVVQTITSDDEALVGYMGLWAQV